MPETRATRKTNDDKPAETVTTDGIETTDEGAMEKRIAKAVADALRAQRAEFEEMLRRERAERALTAATEAIRSQPPAHIDDLGTRTLNVTVDLQSFSGNFAIDAITARDWLEMFSDFAGLDLRSQEPLPRTARNLLSSRLVGDARELYFAAAPTTPTELTASLTGAFPESTPRAAKEAFEHFRRTTPSIDVHVVRFRCLYLRARRLNPRECDYSEETLAEYFRNSLHAALSEELYKWQLVTLDAMIAKARHLEPAYPFVPPQVNQLTGGQQTVPLTDDERARCLREGRCFRCKAHGHRSRECPLRAQPGNGEG
ncbi:CCHC-type domain-containing protein [Plasmodiophora brassicae]